LKPEKKVEMSEKLVNKLVCARIPTTEGEFQLCLYENPLDEKEHMALVMGEVAEMDNVLVRVHSECFTGDVLGSKRCDCGEQLARSMQMIAGEGSGVVIYLRQEGRGIGLLNKLKAYNLQDEGYDTVEANLLLGHQPDERDFTVAAHILRDLNILSIRLLTNNPEKIETLESLGINVRTRVRISPTVNPENHKYLKTKVERMNHLFSIQPFPVNGGGQQNGAL
jgi:GTP cyclohydrolase II